MVRKRQSIGSLLGALVAVGWPMPGVAQVNRPTLDLSIGSYHHSSDLHPYYATRFDDALVIGGGVSLPLHRMAVARVVVERVSTNLSGGEAFGEGDRGSDSILSAEVQVAGIIGTDRVKSYVGAGIGLRRYVVNSAILSDDIIHAPWAEPQIQPAISGLAGVGVSISRRFGVAAEVRWSRARFRVADDSWGLPEDPVAWHQEFRPAVRLEVFPW